MESEGYPRAEEVLRLLAAAAYSARLYPPSSALPGEAAAAFADRANGVAGLTGPLRYTVDPKGFRLGDVELAAGQSQIVTFAEALHALQVGQLIIAPGVTAEEARNFVAVANADHASVRSQGGVRALLVKLGIAHLAVIEVTLRASEEEGLLGVDLMAAPLDEVAEQLASAAKHWARSATAGAGEDDVATAVGRLQQATREIASQRVAQALMRLDEDTRMKVLGWSLKADANGHRMEGMLGIISRMKPAALARLLKLVAAQAGTDPQRIAGALELPPETSKILAMLLEPGPSYDPDFGYEPTAQTAERMAEIMAEPEDSGDIERQVALSATQLASSRSLATATAIAQFSPDVDNVRAIASVLGDAARDGAFPVVREALRRLDELALDPALTEEVAVARNALADPEVLSDVCAAPVSDADAAMAGEILHAAGTAGAEALLEYYVKAPEGKRSLLRPVMRGMSEQILGVASRLLRTDDSTEQVAIVRVLPVLGDKRTVPVVAAALESIDPDVRRAAVDSLAEIPGPEAGAALARAVNHWDGETQRYAIQQIGRCRVTSALPALVRALNDIKMSGRSHDVKKEIVKAIEAMGSQEGLPVLKRVANRRLVIGRKNKELRLLARRAVSNLTMVKAVADATSPTALANGRPSDDAPEGKTPAGKVSTGAASTGVTPTGMTPTSALRMNTAAYRGGPDMWAPPMEGVDPL
jgi:HEAT repeats